MKKSKAIGKNYWKQYRDQLKVAKQAGQQSEYEVVFDINLKLVRELIELLKTAISVNEFDTVARLHGAIDSRVTAIYTLCYPEKKIDHTARSLTSLLGKELQAVGVNTKKNMQLARYKLKAKTPLHKLKTATLNDEDAKTEFKKSFSLKEAIAKSVVAFANTQGGKVYIGIAENKDVSEEDNAIPLGNNFSIVGSYNNTDEHRQKMFAFLQANTNLDTSMIAVTVLRQHDKNVVTLSVPSVLLKTGEVSFFKEQAYVRTDNYNTRLSSKDVYDLVKSRAKPIYSKEDVRHISIEEKSKSLLAVAYYHDGTSMKDFKGYWYGWQDLKNNYSPVWTPLGYNKKSIPKPELNNFTGIYVYKYEVKNNHIEASNTHGVFIPG